MLGDDASPAVLKQARLAKEIAILQTIKNMCDVVTGADSLYKPKPVLGLNYTEGHCALAGLMSSVVGIRMVYLTSAFGSGK